MSLSVNSVCKELSMNSPNWSDCTFYRNVNASGGKNRILRTVVTNKGLLYSSCNIQSFNSQFNESWVPKYINNTFVKYVEKTFHFLVQICLSVPVKNFNSIYWGNLCQDAVKVGFEIVCLIYTQLFLYGIGLLNGLWKWCVELIGT